MLSPTAGAPPRKQRSGPQAITPGSRPNAEVAIYATIATSNITEADAVEGLDVATCSSANGQPKRMRRGLPIVYASVFAPAGRRTRWMGTYICHHCGHGHLVFSETEAGLRGLRHRGSCGRKVTIKIARTYRGKGSASD